MYVTQHKDSERDSRSLTYKSTDTIASYGIWLIIGATIPLGYVL